ncbi:MAG: hypothetical protein AB1411_02650 [Nitrospirota bacterium]
MIVLGAALHGCERDPSSQPLTPAPVAGMVEGRSPVTEQALQNLLEQAPSSAEVQAIAYRLIDWHGAMLKRQVDLAVAAWDTLSPEQRRQVASSILGLAGTLATRVNGSGLRPGRTPEVPQ